MTHLLFWFDLFLEASAEILTKIVLLFWSIWRHQKDISKLTDLYHKVYFLSKWQQNRNALTLTDLIICIVCQNFLISKTIIDCWFVGQCKILWFFFVSFENLKRYLFLVQWCYFIVLMSTPLLENGRAFWKHPSLLCGRKKMSPMKMNRKVWQAHATSVKFWNPHLTH